MRHLTRFARSVLHQFSILDAVIKRYLLIPARRWLTLQHFTALVLLLYALALVTNPGVTMTTLADAIHYPHLPTAAGLLFLFCAALLFGRPVSELRYRILTLPLLLYFWAVVYYIVTHPGVSWTGAISALAIWAFLQVARTELPPLE